MNRHPLLLLLIILLVVTGCGRKEPPKTDTVGRAQAGKPSVAGKQKGAVDGIEHKVLSFNLEGMTEKGEKKWEITGSTARSISENEVRLDNIVAKTYGDEAAVISADQGIYDKLKNNVRLEKNVIATIENKGSAAKDQAGFPSFDLLSSGSKTADNTSSQEKKKDTVITCDGPAEFDCVNNLAYFKDNVKVTSADGDIDADMITVNLNPGTKKIVSIVAEGRVKINQGDSASKTVGDQEKEKVS